MRPDGVRTYTYVFINEVNLPKGQDHDYTGYPQQGVRGSALYTLEPISGGVTLDREGNAVATEPGTYDGETGTIKRIFEEGTVITLPAPTREGYTLDCWKGSRYKAGQKYEVKEDHCFTAQWEKKGEKGEKGGPKTGDDSNLLL